LIAETLKCEPTITSLNLSDCFLPVDGIKNILDLVNQLTNLKGNNIGNNLTIYISKLLLNNFNITEYVKFFFSNLIYFKWHFL